MPAFQGKLFVCTATNYSVTSLRTHLREPSHIDFVHEKRHMNVSLEAPTLETLHIVIDSLFL